MPCRCARALPDYLAFQAEIWRPGLGRLRDPRQGPEMSSSLCPRTGAQQLHGSTMILGHSLLPYMYGHVKDGFYRALNAAKYPAKNSVTLQLKNSGFQHAWRRCAAIGNSGALTIVDDLGNQDADGDGQLEHDVELAADLDRGNLTQVQRHRLCGKACRMKATL